MKLFNITFSLLLLLLFSCGKDSSCIKNAGKLVSETRPITSEINHIVLKDNIDLVLTQDSFASLRIEAGSNLLPYVRARQKGNTLELKNDNKCNFLRSYKNEIIVYLALPNIKSIDYTGHGNISSSGVLTLSELTFDTKNGTGSVNLQLDVAKLDIFLHTGPTDFKLTGKAENIYLYSGGIGWIYCDELIGKKVHTNNAGTGDIILTATETLLIELTSIGNIDYYGTPTVTVSTNSGKGKIRKK